MPSNITYSRIGDDVRARWAKVRAVCAGADAVKAGKYLPYLNKQDISEQNVARNAAYVERAMFYDATGNTLRGLLGLAFRIDPAHNIPERLQYLLTDADGAGVSVYQQSQSVLANVLQVGRHGLYVDFSDAMSRPVIKPYAAESIINWRTSLVGGKTVLTLVVLAETAEEDDGYGIEYVEQWRELALEDGRFVARVWRMSDGGEPVIVKELAPDSTSGKLDFIPFAFVGSENNDQSIDPAPLFGLAELNIGHFRNSADYEDSVFFVGQAQPWIAGLSEEWRDWMQSQAQIYIGSRSPLLLPENGAFGFAQVQPNMLAKEAMDQKEAQMVALGARIIEPSQASKTATEASGDREASTSVLAMCVANVSEAYKAAIAMCGRYLSLDVEAEYRINQDFVRMSAEPSMITALVAAWQAGAFSKVDLRAFLRRLSVIDVERTDEEIEDELQAEGPALGTVGMEDADRQ